MFNMHITMYSTLYVILRLFLYSSVADPESFSADPDPTFYADADPDPNFFNYGEKKCFFSKSYKTCHVQFS